jgi:predicted nucleic acid-binding protein
MPAEPGRQFFDSNTLLYLISEDTEKARRVERRLFDRGCISVQVLNEFTNVARRKHGLTIAQIRPLLHEFRRAIDVVPVTIAIHEAGLTLAERYRFSTYDAMIAAAALDSGCSVLLSEDMHDGLSVEGRLEIRNPFA